MDAFKLLYVLLLSTVSVRGFWWSSNQNSDPPASKQIQYVRAFTYQPVAFPAHSLLAPPSAYKFISQSSPALLPNSLSLAKQVTPLQPVASQPAVPSQPSVSSPFSSFFGNAFGGPFGSSSAPAVSHQLPMQNDGPSYNQGATVLSPQTLPAPAFYSQPQQQPSKYPYFTMDQMQYLSSLPPSAHTPQVQFVPCMCPIAVNVQSVAEMADKRLDETSTTDPEVAAPSTENEK
ncbi:uncharacterized protein LOC131207187 [Anopheles bellator]|uniref:uncharacterized protein LOC131207187 n=1 Tax=Anopheles bellator TaxID=139047 RepID=UPI002647FF4D|nr:uncharacterized protein LOC131207187 [Anopheles bellator]